MVRAITGELKILLRARSELYTVHANFRRENDTNV